GRGPRVALGTRSGGVVDGLRAGRRDVRAGQWSDVSLPGQHDVDHHGNRRVVHSRAGRDFPGGGMTARQPTAAQFFFPSGTSTCPTGAPVCSPFLTTGTPLTRTCGIPVAYA